MRNSPLTIRFALDAMLGRLARHLLHTGYDTFYRDSIEDNELSRIARESNRVLITRDRDFLRGLNPGPETLVLGNRTLKANLRALRSGVNLTFYGSFFFTRCSGCNRSLKRITKEEVRDSLPEETSEWIDTYYRCEECEKIYWKGSHHEDLIEKFREWNLLDENPK